MTRNVYINACGAIPVGEHWQQSLRQLGNEAIAQTLNRAGRSSVDMLIAANAYGATFNSQTNLGPLLADSAGLRGCEAFTVEAGDASGGAAVRQAYLAIRSGLVDSVLVVGVEKATDIVGAARTRARTVSLDADGEALHGATDAALAGLLMRRYMAEYELDVSAFEGFSINAHANGQRNPLAMYRNALRVGAFAKAPIVSDPVNLFDQAPDGDGAAAILLTSQPSQVEIIASAAMTDSFMLQERRDMLAFNAVADVAARLWQQSQLGTDAIDFIELQDSFTIISALTMEALGLAARGEGWQWADPDAIGLQGSMPISTFGGMKSRGNPAGAAGVYQVVEAAMQLSGEAGDNQVADATTGMVLNASGLANMVVGHILQAR